MHDYAAEIGGDVMFVAPDETVSRAHSAPSAHNDTNVASRSTALPPRQPASTRSCGAFDSAQPSSRFAVDSRQ